MRAKKVLDRILKGNEVAYDSETVYPELLFDLNSIESIRKDSRAITNDQVIAAEPELRIKWALLEPEISVYLAAERGSDKIKTKVELRNRLLQIYNAEQDKKRPVIVPVTPVVPKTPREKIEERNAKSNEKKNARLSIPKGAKVNEKPAPDKPKKDK